MTVSVGSKWSATYKNSSSALSASASGFLPRSTVVMIVLLTGSRTRTTGTAETRNVSLLSVAADMKLARQIADWHTFRNIRCGIDQRDRVQIGHVQLITIGADRNLEWGIVQPDKRVAA